MQVESGNVPSWRRFVSEEESNKQLSDLLERRKDATKAVAEINTKLEQLAVRFHEVGDNLKRYSKHNPNRKLYEDEELTNSLRFGPQSGVNVDELVAMIQERDRQNITLEGIAVDLRNRGHNL